MVTTLTANVYECTFTVCVGNLTDSERVGVPYDRVCFRERADRDRVASAETPHLAQELEDRSVVVGETVALQCKALGSPPPRITWLKGDDPLAVTERHHFTPGNQLLIIRSVSLDDAGRYTCVMSNRLGTERAHSQLTVQRSATCGAAGARPDGTITVGIIVIAVVTSIVITSLVWVCIIYQTRKKSEECSVTNTGETPFASGLVFSPFCVSL